MHTGELRARIMAYTDNLDPQDDEFRGRARRIVQDIQEVGNDIWNHRLWRHTLGSAVLTVPQGLYTATLPADFGNIHKEGGIFIDSKRLTDLSSHLMDDIQQGIYSTGSQLGYTISGFSDADQRPTVIFDTPGPLSPVIKYKKKAPLLADRPWVGYPVVVESGAGGLTGTFKFRATYTTRDGHEHEFGDTVTIVLAAKQVSVTGPDPGPLDEHSVSAINVYRTTAGPGATYYRFWTWSYGDSLIVADNTSDAALILLPPLIDYNPLARLVPEQYHFSVLLPGVRALRQQGKGDTRDFEKSYFRGLAQMVVQERPFQSELQQLPRWSPYARD